MPVPLLDLRAQYARIKPEIDAAVAEVFETQYFVGGPRVEALEAAIAEYAGATHAVGVASGTDALLLLLRAIDVNPGDEVITSPFTFFATAGTIFNAGATPVFVDIRPDTFNIDPERIADAITPQTRAIMPVHLFGQCADVDPIMKVAEERGVRVLEDAAQAIGASYKNRKACALGHAAALSFFPSKNLGGAGDGGMVITSDDALAEGVRLLRSHGAVGTYVHSVVGTNSRLDALQAAVLLVKLTHLDQWVEERRANAAYYEQHFAEIPEVVTPLEREDAYHGFNQYVIRLPRRDEAVSLLKERGIGCSVYYPLPLHQQACFAHLGYRESDFPHATQASREVLALPIYPELSPEQQDEVIQAVKDHLAAA